MKKILLFVNLIFLSFTLFSQSDSDLSKVYSFVEKSPGFPGGSDSLYAFYAKNLIYSKEEMKSKKEGRVLLSMIVGKDGTIRDVKVKRALSPACDKAALQLIPLMPKWIPGEHNGFPVDVYYNLPVPFKLRK